MRRSATRLDVDTLQTAPATALELNDIARCVVATHRELRFDPYEDNRTTGSFILIDRLTNATVGAGMIRGSASNWDAQAASTLTDQPSATATRAASIQPWRPAPPSTSRRYLAL